MPNFLVYVAPQALMGSLKTYLTYSVQLYIHTSIYTWAKSFII